MSTAEPLIPPRKLLEHALLLIARQHGGDAALAEEARGQFAHWRAASPLHEAAAQVALSGWAATEASALRDRVQMPPSRAQRDIRSRRRLVQALAVAGIGLATGAAARWHWLQPLQQLAARTERGELRAQRLQDDSQLDLGPRTEARVELFRDRREVRLATGEMRFEVAHDATRPFEVLTDWGRVRVLGTAFTVEVHDGRMRVAVERGRVAVWSAQGMEAQAPVVPAVELTAGQSILADRQGLGAVGRVAPGDVGAWRQGWLVFDQTPLSEVVERWNAYLSQPLALADERALRELRLTGSFPVRDPGVFLQSLQQVLPVQVSSTVAGSTIRLRR